MSLPTDAEAGVRDMSMDIVVTDLVFTYPSGVTALTA